ncbi:MAG: histidine kinase dimerization/phosphoacceptor domain-containing protein, partial [Kangiellaceae bacterium]|nr:histidine kinase dimerization/phosphoacceptor domain-containing protein [Kangiellaceae bacterium]
MKSFIKKIDRRLLPDSEENRLAPYVWLIYLSIFYFSMAFGKHSGSEYLAATLGSIVFLALYFWAYWLRGWNVYKAILGIMLLGSYFGTVTPGANVFFVYAGAFCCRLGNPKRAMAGLAFITLSTLTLSWSYQLSPYFYIPAIMFTLMVGGVNIFQAEIEKKRKQLLLSQEEVRTLARTAERERIARDLHDLIGHTFSVITLKAELAGKLVDKDLPRAKGEIKQLENISRDALKQVREVVTGFRASDLNDEFAHAKFTLESNDINFEYQFED